MSTSKTFQQYADRTFADFLDAARAQGIEIAQDRMGRIVDLIEHGVLAQLNDDDKLVVRKFCHVLRANLDQDKAQFQENYRVELAMAGAVLVEPAAH